MEAKEKASQLVKIYFSQLSGVQFSTVWVLETFTEDSNWSQAKQLALICVDVVISTHLHSEAIALGGYNSQRTFDYWQEVKIEIKNI